MVTINNKAEPSRLGHWNENNVKSITRIDWRASLVPAAAVIPAPIAYIKVVAVKKLVVDPLGEAVAQIFGAVAILHLWMEP